MTDRLLDSLYIDRSDLKVSRVMDQLIEPDILPAILSLKAFINRTVIPSHSMFLRRLQFLTALTLLQSHSKSYLY